MISQDIENDNMTARDMVSGLCKVAKLQQDTINGFERQFERMPARVSVAAINRGVYPSDGPAVHLSGDGALGLILAAGGQCVKQYEHPSRLGVTVYEYAADVDGVSVFCLFEVGGGE